VTNAEAKTVVRLLEEVERLQSELTRGTRDMETARPYEERIDEARAVMMRKLILEAGRWSQLSTDQQRDLLVRLKVIRDELLTKKNIAPAKQSSYRLECEDEPKHLMLWLTLCGFVFAATLLSLIR
jgi:hypothetical protein